MKNKREKIKEASKKALGEKFTPEMWERACNRVDKIRAEYKRRKKEGKL